MCRPGAPPAEPARAVGPPSQPGSHPSTGRFPLRPVRVLVTLVIALRRHWVALGGRLSAVLLSELAIGPLKALLDRPRPPGALIATSAASYPSGHATASAVTAIGVVMALTGGRRRLHWMVTAVCIAAATVRPARPRYGQRSTAIPTAMIACPEGTDSPAGGTSRRIAPGSFCPGRCRSTSFFSTSRARPPGCGDGGLSRRRPSPRWTAPS